MEMEELNRNHHDHRTHPDLKPILTFPKGRNPNKTKNKTKSRVDKATESVVVNTACCLSSNGIMADWGLSLITMIGVSPTGIMEYPDVPVEG